MVVFFCFCFFCFFFFFQAEDGIRDYKVTGVQTCALPISVLVGCVIPRGDLMSTSSPALRVPAEWEPHAATWMQWPGRWEGEMRPDRKSVV